MKSIKAWAVVSKIKPKINTNDIFSDKNVVLTRHEKLIRVIISEVVKKKR